MAYIWSKGATSKFRLGLASIGWPWHHHLHLIYHVWAQTHCLTGGKHLGCYNPPPLKESRPEIRCEELSKGREACYPMPTSASASGYLASSIREANWARHFLILALHRNFCLKKNFPSLTSMKHFYFGRNPRQYGPSFMVYEEYYKHGLTTRSIFSGGIVCTTFDKGWIHIRGNHSSRLSETV
jgi:hypothetical protein